MDKSEVWYGMMICYVLHLLTIYRQKYTNRVPKRGRSGAWAGPRRSTVAEVQRHWALLGDFRWQHDSMNSIGCLGISGKHQSNIISPTFWWIMWNIYWFIILYTLSFSVNQWKKCKDKSYINQWKNAKTNHIFSKTDQNSNLLIHHISRASTHAMSRSRRPPHAALLGLLQPGRFFKSGGWTPKSWPC